MKYYLLFGPPGAGKGTQAKLMVEKYNFHHVSTGDLLRKEIAAETELGKIAKQLIDNGNFVDDSIVVAMIKNEIANNQDVAGFILDGFPRTTPQAEILDQMLAERGEQVNKVISIVIPDEMVFECTFLESYMRPALSAETIPPSVWSSGMMPQSL